MNKKNNFLRFVPAALYYAAIFYLSSQNLQIRAGIPHLDKLLHGLEFAGFGFLLAFGFLRTVSVSFSGVKTLLPLAAGMVFAALDELHQSFVPGRQCDIVDFLADSAGIIVGIGLFLFLRRQAGKKEIKHRPSNPVPAEPALDRSKKRL